MNWYTLCPYLFVGWIDVSLSLPPPDWLERAKQFANGFRPLWFIDIMYFTAPSCAIPSPITMVLGYTAHLTLILSTPVHFCC